MAHIGPTEIYTQLTYNDARNAPQTQDMPGTVWHDIDVTLGVRKFRFVQLKSTSDNAVAGDVVVWTNNYATVVSTKQADSNRNCLAGVAIGALTAAKYGWIQTDGYHAGVKAKALEVFALGKQVILDSTDKQVVVGTDGTAAGYPQVGTALADQAAGKVATHLHVGRSCPSV